MRSNIIDKKVLEETLARIEKIKNGGLMTEKMKIYFAGVIDGSMFNGPIGLKYAEILTNARIER